MIFVLFAILSRGTQLSQKVGLHYMKSYCVLSWKATYRDGESKIVSFPFVSSFVPFPPWSTFKNHNTLKFSMLFFQSCVSFREVTTLKSIRFYVVPSRLHPKKFMSKRKMWLQKVSGLERAILKWNHTGRFLHSDLIAVLNHTQT